MADASFHHGVRVTKSRKGGLTLEADLRAQLVKAVDHALTGDWEAAHEIAQQHEGEAIADWIHAVAHRMEGDLGNARYWYGRCRRALREDVPTETELGEIRAALAGG